MAEGTTPDLAERRQYPAEAVEVTVTFLCPVTEENRQEADGLLMDHLEKWPGPQFVERIAHYKDGAGMLARYDMERPKWWVRPKAPRRRRG